MDTKAKIQHLKRGTVDLISEHDLQIKLKRQKPLRVKLGADPTRPDLHLGHAVILKKMRQFQDMGHRAIMLIGDFTAMIGDPSGKNKTRPPLSLETARSNAQSYLDQCKWILKDDPQVLEIRWNSEWLEQLGFKDLIELTGKYTVARILEREDFRNRLQNGLPISMHETLYPLAQAYDSVALNADIELGGTDQLFNLLVGRDIQREYNQEPQVVMTLPLLVGLDGTEKMSKSLDNYIGLTDSPEQMYAKLMKVPDSLLVNYFTLLTDLEDENIQTICSGHPIVAHRILAALITSWLTSRGALSTNLDLLRRINRDDYNTTFGSIYGFAQPEILSILEQAISDMQEVAENIERLLEFGRLFNLDEGSVSEITDFHSELQLHIQLVSENLNFILEAEPERQNQIVTQALEVSKAAKSPDIRQTLEEIKTQLLLEIERKLHVQHNLTDFFGTALQNFQGAKQRYESVAKGTVPHDIPTVEIDEEESISVVRLAVLANLCSSNGEARRLIQNKGLKLDGQTVLDPLLTLTLDAPHVIQKGKDRFVRIERKKHHT